MLRTHQRGGVLKKPDDKPLSNQSNTPSQDVAPSGAAEIRIRKDLANLDLPRECTFTFPNGEDDIREMKVWIKPESGFWKGCKISFSISFSVNYPHEPPKVKCLHRVFHPNLDLDGGVCLNILREEWSPVLSVYSIIIGLLHLFLYPEPNGPLNPEAAARLINAQTNGLPSNFQRDVDLTKRGKPLDRGGYAQGEKKYDNIFDNVVTD